MNIGLEWAGGFGGIVGLGNQRAKDIEPAVLSEEAIDKMRIRSYRAVSLARMAVLRSARRVAIIGGVVAVEFQRTWRKGALANLPMRNMVEIVELKK